MRIEPELGSASIVLLGKFNPTIYQPFWLAKHGLIPQRAAETAEIAIIHQEIAAFSLDSFFNIQVDRGRFSIERSIAPLILICDVTVRMFTDVLPHTPISQMGINRIVHFNVGEQERNRIGHLLAPRSPWGSWGQKISG